MKVDEQRNCVYSLKEVLEGKCEGHSIVEVFDLGYLGINFDKRITITSIDLMRRVHEFKGYDNPFYEDKYSEALDFRI